MILRSRVLLPSILLFCALSAGVRDLDVAVPPGSPLDWGRSFPALRPPRASLFPRTGGDESKPELRTTSQPSRADPDLRTSSSFGLVRILTWDLTAHMPWIGPKAETGPLTGGTRFGPPPPRYGEPLYWVTLAPLLRWMLHPDVVTRPETLGHLIEIGEPVLGILPDAATEKSLREICAELARRITPADSVAPRPHGIEGEPEEARAAMLARFVFDELGQEHAYDPAGTFGRRIFLFAEELEPILRRYAASASAPLQRQAIAALARYETPLAATSLFEAALQTSDPVVLVRALSGLARFRTRWDWTPLVRRLRASEDPVERVVILTALGRSGSAEVVPAVLGAAVDARQERDVETLMAALPALCRLPPGKLAAEIEALAVDLERDARNQPRPYALQGERSEHRADQPDPPNARAQLMVQLALFLRVRFAPDDTTLVQELLALVPRQISRGGRTPNRWTEGPLRQVLAPLHFLFLDALQRIGGEGNERLAALARTHWIETPLRGYALSRLPFDERAALATELVLDAEEPAEMRLQALEVLLFDHHPKTEEICRKLLPEGSALPSGAGDAAARFLHLRTIRALSGRGRLTTADLLPLLHHAKSARHAFDDLPDEVRERVRELVALAASGAPRVEVEPVIEQLVGLVVENRMNPRIDEKSRSQTETYVAGQISGAKSHRSDPGYLELVVATVTEHLLGYGAPRFEPGRAEFAPQVLLEEEILLALGRTRETQAAEVLVQFLGNKRNRNRAVACLALGMTGHAPAARHLAPFLLDDDAFTRFCAAEGVRHLTEKDWEVDWMYGASEERFRAAEEAWQWLLENDR